MRLKQVVLVGAVLCGGFAPAHAYESFIPLGTGYSTNVSELPSLNSDSQSLSAQTDIYETEIYRRALEERKHKSAIKQFFSGSDFSTPDPFAY
jgi:hypothetical protein